MNTIPAYGACQNYVSQDMWFWQKLKVEQKDTWFWHDSSICYRWIIFNHGYSNWKRTTHSTIFVLLTHFLYKCKIWGSVAKPSICSTHEYKHFSQSPTHGNKGFHKGCAVAVWHCSLFPFKEHNIILLEVMWKYSACSYEQDLCIIVTL